jgi:transcriptional regulator with AAA-type ATPase domain
VSGRTGTFSNDELIFSWRAPLNKAALDLVARVARTRAAVLVAGQTGTEKELIARWRLQKEAPCGETRQPINTAVAFVQSRVCR